MEDNKAAGDIDVEKLMAEVADEVARKRREGEYPPDILLEMEAAERDAMRSPERGLEAAVAQIELSSHFSSTVATASSKKLVAPAASKVKGVIQTTVKWYVGAVLDQITLFAKNVVDGFHVVSRRMQTLEEQLDRLEKEIQDLKSRRPS